MALVPPAAATMESSHAPNRRSATSPSIRQDRQRFVGAGVGYGENIVVSPRKCTVAQSLTSEPHHGCEAGTFPRRNRDTFSVPHTSSAAVLSDRRRGRAAPIRGVAAFCVTAPATLLHLRPLEPGAIRREPIEVRALAASIPEEEPPRRTSQ